LLGTLGTGAIAFGIPLVLTTAVSAYHASRGRGCAAVAFIIGVLQGLVVVGNFVAPALTSNS